MGLAAPAARMHNASMTRKMGRDDRLPRTTRTRRSAQSAADLPPEYQHDRQVDHLRRRLRGLRCTGARLLLDAFFQRDEGRRRRRTAGAVRPQAPRRRTRARLPILSHDGRDLSVRGGPADAYLHELPFADLVGQPDPPPGPREPRQEGAARLEPGPRPPRLRLFRPLDPRQQGGRLRLVSWTGRRDAADVQGRADDDGVVPRLPPEPRAAPPPQGRGLQHDVPAPARRNSSPRGRS